MAPGFDDAKTTEMRARLDDRLGLWAVTYLLFFVKLGPWSWSSPSGSAGDGCAGKRRSVSGLAKEFAKKLPSYLRRMAAGRATTSDFSLRGAATIVAPVGWGMGSLVIVRWIGGR